MEVSINSNKYEKKIPYKVEITVKDTILLTSPYGQGVIMNIRTGELLGDYLDSTTFYDEKSQLFIQKKRTDEGVVVNIYDPLWNRFVLKDSLCVEGDIISNFAILKSQNGFHFLNKANYRADDERLRCVRGYTKLSDDCNNYIVDLNESYKCIYLEDSGVSENFKSIEVIGDALVFSSSSEKKLVYLDELNNLDEVLEKRESFTSCKRDGDYYICSNCVKDKPLSTKIYYKKNLILEENVNDASLLYNDISDSDDMYSYILCRDGGRMELVKVYYTVNGKSRSGSLRYVGYDCDVECLDGKAGLFKITNRSENYRNNGCIGLYSYEIGMDTDVKYEEIVKLNEQFYAFYCCKEEEECDIYDVKYKSGPRAKYCKVLNVENGKVFYENYGQICEMEGDSVRKFSKEAQLKFFKDFYVVQIIERSLIYNYADELLGMRPIDCNILSVDANFTYYNIDGTFYIYNKETKKLEELMELKQDFYQAAFVCDGQEYEVETMSEKCLEKFFDTQEESFTPIEDLKIYSEEVDWAPLVFTKKM